MYLIEILHQTTTRRWTCIHGIPLYLIEILHQTTTIYLPSILRGVLYLIEILHQTTTGPKGKRILGLLYLIEILHQTTTLRSVAEALRSCILSKFYIKPQLSFDPKDKNKVVSYRNSTSNHNNTGVLSAHVGVVSYRNSTSNHN